MVAWPNLDEKRVWIATCWFKTIWSVIGSRLNNFKCLKDMKSLTVKLSFPCSGHTSFSSSHENFIWVDRSFIYRKWNRHIKSAQQHKTSISTMPISFLSKVFTKIQFLPLYCTKFDDTMGNYLYILVIVGLIIQRSHTIWYTIWEVYIRFGRRGSLKSAPLDKNRTPDHLFRVS